MNSPTAIVNDYIKQHRKNAEKELHWFSIQRSLADAVSLAALAKSPSGKRLGHQRRIPRAVLEKSRRRLLYIIKELKLSYRKSCAKVETVILSRKMGLDFVSRGS